MHAFFGPIQRCNITAVASCLSRWYYQSELIFRLSLYIVMTSLASTFRGLLAGGILIFDNVGDANRSQMIVLVEGIVTIGIGIHLYRHEQYMWRLDLLRSPNQGLTCPLGSVLESSITVIIDNIK